MKKSKNINSIPSESDWANNKYGLDEKYAYDHFNGKSRDQAFKLFRENALYYQEDLTYMYGKVFDFYLQSYIDYLLSEDSREDSDAASCFIHLIKTENEI